MIDNNIDVLESLLYGEIKNRINIYQIYYDDRSKLMLDPGFIPLDNTENLRPDWFEFWVIRQFLRNQTPCENDSWYGFLSPKFGEKTGLHSDQVLHTLGSLPGDTEVALFSPFWDHIAYFLNPFEGGDISHPGLKNLTQTFLSDMGIHIDLSSIVSHSQNTVYCNFLVAKPAFWNVWLELADLFFRYVEDRQGTFSENTYYGQNSPSPMKTFIQERLTSLLLSVMKFRTINCMTDYNVITGLFPRDIDTKHTLITCDILKRMYCKSNDREYLNSYLKIRQNITLNLNTL